MSIVEIVFSFKGRIGRGTFWKAIIPLGIVTIVLLVATRELAELLPVVIIVCVNIWVSLAIYTKRWHDLGNSGWMNLTLLIPLVNFFILLFLGLAAGTDESNKFGEALGKSTEEVIESTS